MSCSWQLEHKQAERRFRPPFAIYNRWARTRIIGYSFHIYEFRTCTNYHRNEIVKVKARTKHHHARKLFIIELNINGRGDTTAKEYNDHSLWVWALFIKHTIKKGMIMQGIDYSDKVVSIQNFIHSTLYSQAI